MCYTLFVRCSDEMKRLYVKFIINLLLTLDGLRRIAIFVVRWNKRKRLFV